MKRLLQSEEILLFGFSIYLFSLTDFTWWWYPVLILVPDIGMLGYAVNPRIGAFTYNLFHHRGLAALVICTGWFLASSNLELTGIILLGHSSMDRIFGYGLKYEDDFRHTHFGKYVMMCFVTKEIFL